MKTQESDTRQNIQQWHLYEADMRQAHGDRDNYISKNHNTQILHCKLNSCKSNA